MREVRGFTILETEEEVQKHCGCKKHKFKNVPRRECINPNGEFVVGYGSSLIYVRAEPTEEKCVKCGYVREKKGKNESKNK